MITAKFPDSERGKKLPINAKLVAYDTAFVVSI